MDLTKPHPLINPRGPEAYGVARDLGAETRQYRTSCTRGPSSATSIRCEPTTYRTPARRSIAGRATRPRRPTGSRDAFGPFGDPYRRDPRRPWDARGLLRDPPGDAIELGLNDGDYAWIDADPIDRPQWKDDDPVLRRRPRDDSGSCLLGQTRGVIRTWFHTTAPPRERSRARPRDGPARIPRQTTSHSFRHGSHQVRHPRLAPADADDRDADAEELLRPGDRRRLRSRRPLRLRGTRGRHSSRSSAPRTAVPVRRGSGVRSPLGSAPKPRASRSSRTSRAPMSRRRREADPCRR